MPTLSSMNIPPPKSWEEFEDICLSSFKLRWTSPNLTKHGRQGQAQNGVDIYGDDYLGVFVGVQCKKYDLELTKKTIEIEIESAEKFKPELKGFFIATTAPSDAKIQSAVRLISEKRVAAGKFPVGIFFWNDIVQDLANNEATFSKHFPQLNIKGLNSKPSQRNIAILDIVFNGVNFDQSMNLIFSNVNEDPNQLLILCHLLGSAAMQLMEENRYAELIKDLKYIEDYVMPWAEGKEQRPEGWEPVRKLVKKIEQKIIRLQYELANEEMAIFQLGLALAGWDRSAVKDKKISERDEKSLMRLTKKLFGKTPKSIRKELKVYKEDKLLGVWNIPFKCYVICKDRLIRKQLKS